MDAGHLCAAEGLAIHGTPAAEVGKERPLLACRLNRNEPETLEGSFKPTKNTLPRSGRTDVVPQKDPLWDHP